MKKLYALLHVYILLTVITCAAWFISCEEKENFIPLKVFSVEPAEALISDTVLITGEGFSPGIEYNRVYFPGVSGPVEPLKNSTEKKLWVQIPEGALPGPVTVNLFDDEVTESPMALNVMAPVVESVEPSSGIAGDTVTVRGQNFRPEPEMNKVRFNPLNTTLSNPAGLSKVLSASSTELRVVVPLDSRTGKMSVFGFEGTEFTILPPSITRIEPLTGIVGDTISISGRGFGEAESINLRFEGAGSINGKVLKSSTSRKLQVVVPEGARDGRIKISYSSIDLISEQTFEVYPSITGISPLNGRAGMTVTINGYTFSNTKADNRVKFGELAGEVTSASPTQLKAVVPPGTETGVVTVEVNGRVGLGPVFEISADGTPLILNIQPTSGPVGSLVSIKGDYFSATPSENIVRFGGDAQAQVLSASKTELTVKVPVGAVNGAVTVTKESKKGTGPDFTLSDRALPIITSITPELVEPGTNFTIHGGNFTTFANDISIQSSIALGTGTVLKPLTATETELTATLPANAKVGEWSIYINQYNQPSNNDKTITVKGEPQITLLSSPDGTVNSSLTLTGTEFHNIENKNTVKFTNATGDFFVAAFEDVSDNIQNKIQVRVPDSAPPGEYNVTVTAFENVSNAMPFKIKQTPDAVSNVFYASKTASTPFIVKVEKATFGSGTQTVYQATSGDALRSLVVDLKNGKAYFSTVPGIITRSNLDGSGSVQLYASQSATNDLSLDVEGGKLYWSRGANIWKGDTRTIAEGGSAASIIYTATGSAPTIRGLTYSDNKLYFAEVVGGVNNVASIDLTQTPSSTPPQYTKTTLVSGLSLAIADVKIDHANAKLFMLCGTTSSTVTARRAIYVADINGAPPYAATEFHTIPFGGVGNEPSLNGIALDASRKYVYWLKNNDVDGAQGIYRKRYDKATIPGTDPPATFEKVYDVTNQVAAPAIFGGLAIENPTTDSAGQSSSQRKKGGASLRGFSSSFTIEMTNYQNE